MFQVKAHKDEPLAWWYDQRDEIDFEPVYQRLGGLWKPYARAYLIDSILNGFDVPKVYVADFRRRNTRLNTKGLQYAIIDGKQRLQAIFGFYAGDFALNDDCILRDEPEVEVRGLNYPDLVERHPQIAMRLDKYKLSVMSVEADEDQPIYELFVRLNQFTVPLSGAEKRNAMRGVVPILARTLAAHPFFQERRRFDVQRYQDRDVATRLLLIEQREKLVSVKKGDLDRFAESVPQEQGPKTKPYRDTARRLRRHLDTMARIFRRRDPLLSAQTRVPVYYWLVREDGADHEDRVRPFLDAFECEVTETRRRASALDQDLDQELLRYITDRRGPNDGTAMERMYATLRKRFRKFVGK